VLASVMGSGVGDPANIRRPKHDRIPVRTDGSPHAREVTILDPPLHRAVGAAVAGDNILAVKVSYWLPVN